jgi:hypothetical protein
MKRRSFLKGLLAAIAAPLVVTKKLVAGERVPRSVRSAGVYSGVLLRKYRQPIYDEEKIDGGSVNTITLFARSPKTGELAPRSDSGFEVEER